MITRGEIAFKIAGSLWHSQKDAFFKNPYVLQWIQRNHRPLQFLRNRFSKASFFGLPFTIITLALVYIIFLFLSIIGAFLFGNPLIAADQRIANLLYAFREPGILHFFYLVTLFGTSGVIIAIAILLSFLLWIQRNRVFIASLWLALAVSEGITYFGKIVFHRERPDILLRAITEDSFSFPSGHATTAVAFYGFLAYLIVRTHTRWVVRVNALFLAVVAIVLIDFSRLYLGVHYLSDVLAGDLVGLLGLLFAINITEWFLSHGKIKTFSFPLLHLGILGIIEMCVVIGVHMISPSPWVQTKRPVSQKIAPDGIVALFEQGKLPVYTETLTGVRQEPINLIIVAKDTCFVQDFQNAHWMLADRVSLASMRKVIGAALFNTTYPTAPMTPSFYDTRPHDFGFEEETAKQSVRTRHHARFWKTGYETIDGSLYVGTVSLDTGIKWGITHAIAPDIDTERDLLVADLHAGNSVIKTQLLKLVPPTLGKNFTGDQFFTDGKAMFFTLTSCQ